MPSWISTYYPPALRNLAAPVRKKAIEIAERLRNEGYEEATAFRIAIERARGAVPPPLPGWTAKRVRGNSRG